MKKSITQKHFMSCGLACVVYIVGKNYDELASLQSKKKLNSTGFYCPELVVLLKQYGYNYKWRKLSKNEKYPVFNDGDIVFIARSPEIPNGHFLTKTPYGWMDPWSNLAETKNLQKAKSSFREKLPGEPRYIIYAV